MDDLVQFVQELVVGFRVSERADEIYLFVVSVVVIFRQFQLVYLLVKQRISLEQFD